MLLTMQDNIRQAKNNKFEIAFILNTKFLINLIRENKAN